MNKPRKLTVDILNSEKIKTLVELLALYKDELPEKLKESLRDLANHKAFEYGVDWQGEFKCVADGVEIQDNYKITTANIILKRISYYLEDEKGSLITSGSRILEKFLYPDNAKFYINNELMLEW